MSAASAVGATKSAGPSPPAQPSAPTNGGETPLLPDPLSTMTGGADPLAFLYLFEARDQTLGVQQGSQRVSALQTERDQALQKEQQAITNEDNAAKQHGFWNDLGNILGDVAKVAGVIASIAVAVVTLGGATPLAVLAVAAVVLSSVSMADGEFHILQKLGVDPSVAGWIDLGMAVAGSVLSAGTSLAAGAQAASSAANVVGVAASATAGAATMGQGAVTIEEGEAQSDGDRAVADEAAAQSGSQQALRRMQMIIDEVQSSDQESQKLLATIAATKEILNDTATSAAIAVRG